MCWMLRYIEGVMCAGCFVTLKVLCVLDATLHLRCDVCWMLRYIEGVMYAGCFVKV